MEKGGCCQSLIGNNRSDIRNMVLRKVKRLWYSPPIAVPNWEIYPKEGTAHRFLL